MILIIINIDFCKVTNHFNSNVSSQSPKVLNFSFCKIGFFKKPTLRTFIYMSHSPEKSILQKPYIKIPAVYKLDSSQ